MKLDREVGRRKAREGEPAILLGLLLPGSPDGAVDPLDELSRLAETAGAVPLEKMLQKRQRPDPATFVGTGKAEEVGQRAKELGAGLVIVDHDLSPSQARNLERASGVRVVDRTELILDIFARRAKSAIARAQVELAQMEYALPRLKRLWTHLSREVGSGKAGIGTRGPGEKQIETDRRLVRQKIRDLRHALKEMREHRERQTKARERWFAACLVGYTNAGKSTLLRALTGADVLVQDRLFSTVDTTTRGWKVAPGKKIFLSDTVGFIRDLPHHLVESFLATLEEARQADLLLFVVDAADPAALDQVEVVERTLSRIGAGGVPRVVVLNQMDRVRDPLAVRLLESRLPGAVRVSAHTGQGLEDLRQAVLSYVTRHDLDLLVEAEPPGSGRLLARLSEVGEVTETDWPDGRMLVRVRVPPRHVAEIRRLGGRILEGAPEDPEPDDDDGAA